MKYLKALVFWGAVGVLTGCAPYYIASNFEARTADHQKVAVLPVEVVFTGNIPEEITEADLIAIEEAEAQAFQISFYNQVLRSTRSGKKPIRVDLQHYRQTIDRLAEAGIDIHTSWKKDPAELADILGVDAVVRTRIEKMRFMSDLESYGIEIGITLAQVFSGHSFWPWLPLNLTRAKKVKADFSLLDGEEGVTLWSITFETDADWRSPANEIIDGITQRAARKFPYRR